MSFVNADGLNRTHRLVQVGMGNNVNPEVFPKYGRFWMFLFFFFFFFAAEVDADEVDAEELLLEEEGVEEEDDELLDEEAVEAAAEYGTESSKK